MPDATGGLYGTLRVTHFLSRIFFFFFLQNPTRIERTRSRLQRGRKTLFQFIVRRSSSLRKCIPLRWEGASFKSVGRRNANRLSAVKERRSLRFGMVNERRRDVKSPTNDYREFPQHEGFCGCRSCIPAVSGYANPAAAVNWNT